MGLMNQTVTVRLSGMPEVLAGLRREMANLLRQEAKGALTGRLDTATGIAVYETLNRLANTFEAGLKSAADLREDGR